MAQSDPFWESFLATNHRSSTIEQQFLGYLTTQGISPYSTPTVLETARVAFVAWLAASATAVADPGPSRMGLALQQAMEQQQALLGDTLFYQRSGPDVMVLYQDHA